MKNSKGKGEQNLISFLNSKAQSRNIWLKVALMLVEIFTSLLFKLNWYSESPYQYFP